MVTCHDAEPAALCDNDPRLFEDVSPDFSEHDESDTDSVTSRLPPTSTLAKIVTVDPVVADDSDEVVKDLKSTTFTVVSATNVSLTESMNMELKLFKPELVGRIPLNAAVVDVPALTVVEKPDAA